MYVHSNLWITNRDKFVATPVRRCILRLHRKCLFTRKNTVCSLIAPHSCLTLIQTLVFFRHINGAESPSTVRSHNTQFEISEGKVHNVHHLILSCVCSSIYRERCCCPWENGGGTVALLSCSPPRRSWWEEEEEEEDDNLDDLWKSLRREHEIRLCHRRGLKHLNGSQL